MPRAKALKIKVQDRPGLLGEIASALGANGINLRAVHGYTDGGQGVVCLVVDKLAPANKVLTARGLRPEQEELLEVELAHKPGTLGDVSRVLGGAGVNIKYVFLGPASARRATAFFAVSDMGAALKALG